MLTGCPFRYRRAEGLTLVESPAFVPAPYRQKVPSAGPGMLHCHGTRDVWQSGMTLNLPLVENFARDEDEIAGPLRTLTRTT